MFKKPLFKILSIATLALTLSLGLISSAGAAGAPTATPTSAPAAAPTAAPTSAPTSASGTAACTPANAKWTGIKPQANENGLLITDIAKDSPAEKAGLAADRVLLSVNGKNISQQADLDKLLEGAKAGDQMTLEVASLGGTVSKIMVTLSTNGDKPYLGIQGMQVPVVMGPFTLTETTPAACASKPFELSSSIARGLYVASVDQNGAAAKAGLVTGEVITDVKGEPVGTPQHLDELIKVLKAGDELALKVYNPLDQKTSNITITLGDKPALGAQVAVIVEPAATISPTTPASSSGGSHMTIWQDVVFTLRQWQAWLRHHRNFSFKLPSISGIPTVVRSMSVVSHNIHRTIDEVGKLSSREWQQWLQQHPHLLSKFYTRP